MDQTNDELDKLNAAHLEERAQLIHDLQSCEREIDALKDVLLDKDKEISALSGNMAEYGEQITELKQQIKENEEELVRIESARVKAEQEAQIIRESQSSDQHSLNNKIAELLEQLRIRANELKEAQNEKEAKVQELKELENQLGEDKSTVRDLTTEIQKLKTNRQAHLSQCETQISALKDQILAANQKLQESGDVLEELKETRSLNDKLKEQVQLYEKEMKTLKEERNKQIAEVTKYSSELQSLSNQLQAQVECHEQVKLDVNDKLEAVAVLEEKLKNADEERRRMEMELDGKTKISSTLEEDLKFLQTENSSLKTSLEKELDHVKKLSEENIHLKQDAETMRQSVTQISEEKQQLLVKVSEIESQNSEKQKTVVELRKEMETLNINSVDLEQNRNSISETLSEKTDECRSLKKSLEDHEKMLSDLRSQFDILKSQVDQLNCTISEKDRELYEKTAQIQQFKHALNSELAEKDNQASQITCVQSDLDKQRDLSSSLQLECDSLKEQCSRLHQGLEEREMALRDKTHECQSFKKELFESKDFLSGQFESVNELNVKLEAEKTEVKKTLEAMLSSNAKLTEELTQRQAEIVGLRDHIQTLSGQNQQLRALFENKEKELADARLVAAELDKTIMTTLQDKNNLESQVSTLSERNHHLENEVSNLKEETGTLGDKISGLEMQHSENRKIIEGLLKDKEDLSNSFKQKQEHLLKKAYEYEGLSKQLQQAEEAIKVLKDQANMSNTQFNDGVAKKDQIITEQSQEIQSYQDQLAQLQETLLLLQEQTTALKSGLLEKDALLQQKSSECSSIRDDLDHLKVLSKNLQTENETLKNESSRLIQVLTEKEKECTIHTDELGMRNDSLVSLSSQLGDMNENIVKLQLDNEQLKSSLEGRLAEGALLREELSQNQIELVNLQDNIQALKETNSKMKTELQNSVTKTKEQVSALEKQLAVKDVDLASMVQNFSAENAKIESLRLELQQKEESFRQQETFLSQLQMRYESGEDQICQKLETIAELQRDAQNLQRALQEKDVLLLNKDQEISRLGDQIVQDSAASKTRMDSDRNVISKLQVELQELLEKTDRLTSSLVQKESLLQNQVEKNHSMKTSLEEAVSKLNSDLQMLLSETEHLREGLAEKEQLILDSETTHSAQISSLKEILQAEDLERDTLRQQLESLKESVGELTRNLTDQSVEIQRLKEGSSSNAADLNKALQELQMKAEEADLFKNQFMESTELVSQLQSQNQVLVEESSKLSTTIEEKQSALTNLQDKFASQVEELYEAKTLISMKTEEILNLNQMISERDGQINTLTLDSSMLHNEIQQLKIFSTEISKQKDDALADQQMSTNSLTLEIERLKAKHLHVAAQVNSLTENLEQRELALHAINSQYASQVKHTEHVMAEMEKLDELCRKLQEENRVARQELDKANNYMNLKEEEVKMFALKNEELSRSYSDVQRTQEHLQHQGQLQCGSMEKLKAEMEQLQVQVSAKDNMIIGLKSEVQRIEQTLQESEREWLSLLDRETQAKNSLSKRLQVMDDELLSKDSKVSALKQDLDQLNEKLAEATLAIRQGSEKLKDKELDAASSRSKLEEILATVQAKESENIDLRQTLQVRESKFKTLEESHECSQKDISILTQSVLDKVVAFEEERAGLQATVKQLQEKNQSEVSYLKQELALLNNEIQQKQVEYLELKSNCQERATLLSKELTDLQERFRKESENLNELSLKYASLTADIHEKDNKISCMSLQISQQKELLSSLSQQLKSKDDSVMQVVTSASNERIKYEEEKNNLRSELEDVKEHLSVCRAQKNQEGSEIEALIKVNEEIRSELDKTTKEKDALKKKLQAALVIRKDLLRKIEELEKQNEENARNRDEHDTRVSDLNEQIKEKGDKVQELAMLILEKEQIVLHFEENTKSLQEQLKEQEVKINSTLQELQEKTCLVYNLEMTINKKDLEFENERLALLGKLEQLENEVKTMNEEKRSQASGIIQDLESELTKIKQENSNLQKKANAALLARKETIKRSHELEKMLDEIKCDYEELQEKHNQQIEDINAMRSSYEPKVQDLEYALHTTNAQMEALKMELKERERTEHDLRDSLTEQESRSAQELENLKSDLKTKTSELACKEESLVELRAQATALADNLASVRSELNSAVMEIGEKNEEISGMRRSQSELQSKLDMLNKSIKETQTSSTSYEELEVLKNNLDNVTSRLETLELERLELIKELNGKNEEILTGKRELEQSRQEISALQSDHQNQRAFIEELQLTSQEARRDKRNADDMQKIIDSLDHERNLIKTELDNALLNLTQNSEELQALQQKLTTSNEQAFQKQQESGSEIEHLKAQIEMLHDEKKSCIVELPNLKDNILQLDAQNKNLLCKSEPIGEAVTLSNVTSFLPLVSEQVPPFKDFTENRAELQSLLLEKEELISALEQQLQRQIHLHEVEMERMRITISEHQQKTATPGENKSVDQLTKKLQAALISRKELIKENRTIKEELQNLQLKTSSMESAWSELKGQKTDLENSLSTVSTKNQNLTSDVDRILSDNHNLSAACESLKLTIENITQQKQAFSCQLESLKDSQTEELSEWKSKHAELKQEYESLLQAYENVSCEIDKMRQLLEGARRERQEAVVTAHKHESQIEHLGKQITDLEEENEKIKEKMRKFAKVKQQKIELLETENEKIRQDLVSFDDKHKSTIDELTLRNSQLESEISCLHNSSEELREKMSELHQDNHNLLQELKEASSASNSQLRLDEVLCLNGDLTEQIRVLNIELGSQIELVKLLQDDKANLLGNLKQLENSRDVELNERDKIITELRSIIDENTRETVNLNEKVRILEDDKCMLQEELENVQETSDKVKNENEYLETVLLKNSERIDELTETLSVLQTQNMKLTAQMKEVKEDKVRVCEEKDQQHLKLVKEFDEKLKTLQRGTDGSKNIKKELQELLREKHHEINQLQQDCIKYQELILNLERSLKQTEAEHQRVENELRDVTEKVSDLQKDNRGLESELKLHKNILNETKKELSGVSSERDGLQRELATRQQRLESESLEKERLLEKMGEQHQALLKEQRIELQKQISDLLEQNEREAKVIILLQKQVESKDLQLKTLQREAETNSTKLAMLSIDPKSSDITDQWDAMFQKTLRDKDSQLLEQGSVISQLLEDSRAKDKALHDIQIANKKLERAVNEYSVAAAAHQRQLFVMRASSTELSQNVEILTKRVSDQGALIERLGSEKISLMKQLDEQTYSVSQLKSDLDHSDEMLANKESSFLSVQNQCSRLTVELEKQEAISVQMKSLLQSKDAEISSLLSSKEGQMSSYLEQLQVTHHAQVKGYEDRVHNLYTRHESAEQELKTLQTKIESLQAELDRVMHKKRETSANIETLRNSVISLQAEKDHVTVELKQIKEQGHEIAAISEKAAKCMKEEIKSLLNQMDDLNSENAMLKAQLVRYREDLNQVLSLKDNQLKDLLKKQQDTIRNLENQKRSVELQHKDVLMEIQKEVNKNQALTEQKSDLESQVQKLEDGLSALWKEKLEANESKVISDLQQAISAKASECNELQQKILAQRVALDDSNRNLKETINESEKKEAEVKQKYNDELDVFEKEVRLMRSEKEVADQRVTELAKELIQAERDLSEAKKQNKVLKSQNESLGKAMVALQNDRDQLTEDFKILRSRDDEELKETRSSMYRFEHRLNETVSELSAVCAEKNILSQRLQALESKNPKSKLSALLDELTRAISEKDAEIKRVSLEKISYSRQVNAFSKSMASLQSDRDRLLEELGKTRRDFEYTRRSPDAIMAVKSEGSDKVSINVGALQTDRDGPVSPWLWLRFNLWHVGIC